MFSDKFMIKRWLHSGDYGPRVEILVPESSSDSVVDSVTAVLGVPWISSSDSKIFVRKLNFAYKSIGVYTQPNLTVEQVPQSIPLKLTRRNVLEKIMEI